MICKVKISKLASKQLKKMPTHIIQNLMAWVNDVETKGIEETRKLPGYHDEPLLGDRKGQRSVRLSRSYRGFYCAKGDGIFSYISVEEVSKHDY